MTPRAPLACATTLTVLFTVALAQQLCETTQFGNQSQVRMSRPVRRVEPGMFTLEINDPDVCRDSEAVGLKVTACDAGQAPRVLLLDAARGMVVRAGSLAGAALVYSTVYCAEPSDVAPDSEEAPTTDTSTLTTTISASPLLSLSTPDSLQLSEVEPPFILTSTDEYLPPVRLESRFSSIDQSNGRPTSTSLSSRIKDLWKDRVAPSLDQLKSQSFPEGTSSKLQKNEQSLLDKSEHQPSIFDSYSTHIYGFPKSSASLAKRLIDLRPKQAHKWLENRAPSWKRRPTRRPSSPWLKLRSQPDVKTRKSASRSRNRALNAFTDYNDPWTPYEDDPLSLNWSDEPVDSNPWLTDGDPESPYTNNFPWRIKPPKGNNWNEGPHLPVHHERPSPSAIKHDSKKQSRLVPIHEEDPALLLEWNKDRPRSKRPALPKLLLLLQDQENQAPVQRQCSSHSVEDTEPWWSSQPYKYIENEGIPWQADYPADYTADDGDARSYSPGNYIDDRILPPHAAQAKKQELTRPPRHHATPPMRPFDAQLFPHASQKTPPSSKASPLESYYYYSPTPLTERPLLTSTVRNSLPWIKSSNAKPLKLLMKPKQSNSKKLLQKSNHRYPPNHNYPSDYRYPSKPLFPAGTNYPPETHNPPNLPYPSRPNYPPETYNPSHLQSDPFSEAENEFPSKPHLPSGPHYLPETDLESNPFSEVESNFPYKPRDPPEPYYPSESGNIPSVPNYPSEPDYLSELDYPSEPHYSSEPAYPSEYLAPSAPWKFLSKLLLSHPSFRDSTHVIRIR